VPLAEIDDQILIGIAHQCKNDLYLFAPYCIGNGLENLHSLSVPYPASSVDDIAM
jgi:hypothetical protein